MADGRVSGAGVRDARRDGYAWVRGSFTRTFVAWMLVALCVTTLVGVGTYSVASQHLDEQVERSVTSTAELQANALDSWLAAKSQQTRSASAAESFQSGQRDEISYHMVELSNALSGDVVAVHYVNLETGRVVESTDWTMRGANGSLMGAGWASLSSARRDRLTDTSRVAVTDAYTGRDGARRVAFVSSPPRNTRYGVVLVANLSARANALFQTYESGYSRVLDDDGSVVVATGSGPDAGALDAAALSADRDGFETADATVAGYARVDGVGWTGSDRVPAGAAYALPGVVRFVLLATVLGALASVAAVTAVVGRRTNRTLSRLTARAETIADGDLETPVESRRPDEFGRLAGAFERMRRSLRGALADEAAARRAAERERRAAMERSERLAENADYFAHVMAACAAGDLERRIETPATDGPMRRVADAFNEMMDDVQEKTERLEQFSSILSHDLRTPLGVALGRAELLAAEREGEHAEPLVDALDRMDAIIDDALVLARRADDVDVATRDVGDVAADAWEHVDTGAATLVVGDAPELTVNDALLSQAYENLFRNAVEHGGEDVTVEVGGLDDGAGFYVADDGPGIPPEERERVVETGYTTNRSGGGTGFGLTVVSSVASVHDWSFAVTASEAGGARFEFAANP